MNFLTKMQKLCRTNTGSVMCDSGSIYGYNYQRPNQKDSIVIVKGEDNELDGIQISLAHFLAATLEETEHTKKLNKAFSRYVNKDKNKRSSYITLLEDFCVGGYKIRSENTYNFETDLDQDLQYHILTPINEMNNDWIYSKNVLIAIQPHVGCDVRSGYPKPYILAFQRGSMAESEFLDVHTGLYVDEELCKDKETIGLDTLQCGYSNYWQGQARNNENITNITVDADYKIFIHLKDGRKIEACVDCPLNLLNF